MDSISIAAKNLVSNGTYLLNRPIVKEGIKNVAGTASLVFGFIQIYDAFQILKGRKITTEAYADLPYRTQRAHKAVVVCAKISLILSAGVSRPGIFIISTIAGTIFSTSQLARVFGPNTIFAVNPWHPRHIVSFAAVIFALPSLAQTASIGLSWIIKKIRSCNEIHIDVKADQNWLTDSKVRLLALFNTITSRPILHMGNQLSRLIIRSI